MRDIVNQRGQISLSALQEAQQRIEAAGATYLGDGEFLNSPGVGSVNNPLSQTSKAGAFCALAPGGGIPALTGISTPTPGTASCAIYQIISGVLYLVTDVTQTVYNLSTTAIDAGKYVPIVLDKYGSWIVALVLTAGALTVPPPRLYLSTPYGNPPSTQPTTGVPYVVTVNIDSLPANGRNAGGLFNMEVLLYYDEVYFQVTAPDVTLGADAAGMGLVLGAVTITNLVNIDGGDMGNVLQIGASASPTYTGTTGGELLSIVFHPLLAGTPGNINILITDFDTGGTVGAWGIFPPAGGTQIFDQSLYPYNFRPALFNPQIGNHSIQNPDQFYNGLDADGTTIGPVDLPINFIL